MSALNPPIHIRWYLLVDFIMSVTVWVSISFFRLYQLGEASYSVTTLLITDHFFFLKSFLTIPAFWMLLFTVMGAYKGSIYTKSRLSELTNTIIQSLTGCLIIFFSLFLNDKEEEYIYFYKVFFAFWGLQSFLVFSGRAILLGIAKSHLLKGKYYFRTLFIGNNKKALETFKEINEHLPSLGYKFIGFISADLFSRNCLLPAIPRLGNLEEAEEVLSRHKVQQVIVALDKTELNNVQLLIKTLSEKNVMVKVVPDNFDIFAGTVKTGNVMGAKLIDITTNVMPLWQENIKQAMDTVFALLSSLLLCPLFIFVALRTKLSSAGPIIYTQERIGFKGKPFIIYKFRSMYDGAEKNGPMLSSETDQRITPWGKIMRKWRLDELPQLWNILKGDMSLVGPRPERKFYIEQVTAQNPYYKYLLKVRPGLTSWGMVRFGYASTVEEMAERMKYDLMYVENATLLLDFKIMIYTLKIILSGKGK